MCHYAFTSNDPAIHHMRRCERGEETGEEGTVKQASFMLVGQDFRNMDSAIPHDFRFSKAVSFMVPCDSQEEMDCSWQKLSAVPEAERYGWLKDRFGVS